MWGKDKYRSVDENKLELSAKKKVITKRRKGGEEYLSWKD